MPYISLQKVHLLYEETTLALDLELLLVAVTDFKPRFLTLPLMLTV